MSSLPEIKKEKENMLDINLFREEKGNNPELIRESQRRRFANVEIVDDIIHLDNKLRQRQFELEHLHEDYKELTIEVAAKLKIDVEVASFITRKSEENSTAKKYAQVLEARAALYSKLELVGNFVHDSVPVINDEANNVVVRTWGEKRTEPKLKNHVELLKLFGIADPKKGANVAGGRGFFLKGDGVRLNEALINFGLYFLKKRGFTQLQTPLFVTKDVMGKYVQLTQFDEELCKVTVGGEDRYLFDSEQPLCAYHSDDLIHPEELPLRYMEYSTCFRKEAVSHVRDTLGIFSIQPFKKIEQSCITSPNGNDSMDMHEEMIKNSEEFYQMLKLPYRVVSIVSGALNDATTKKYNLEAWFPGSNSYKELVSCSNCTDYESRKLNIRFRQKKGNEETKQYCHLLNSTLTETERTMCCILENYQREDGVEVPEVLQPFMGGKTFMPFQAPEVLQPFMGGKKFMPFQAPSVKETKGKKSNWLESFRIAESENFGW